MLGCVLLVGSVSIDARADELDVELNQLDELRATGPADLDELERRGKELLERYTRPADQARIHLQMVHTAAQSGISREPLRLERWIRVALDSNKDVVERGRLFTYLGDVTIVNDVFGPMEVRRRAAADAYLEGLRENLEIVLPDGPIVRPRLGRIGGVMRGLPENDPERIRLLLERQEARMKYDEARYHEEVAFHRKILIGQVAGAYAQRNVDLAEFRALVREKLGAGLPDTERYLVEMIAEIEKRRLPTEPVGPIAEAVRRRIQEAEAAGELP